jgi:hypothetical protein
MGFNPFKAVASIAEKAVRVVAEPAKRIVNEVIDVGADVGENLGNGVRRVAGPLISTINDLHNALMPRFRFDLNVAGKFDANINWPRTTEFDINFKLPGFPKNLPASPPVVGDLTGGFFSNITADRERLRSTRRRLQLMRHIVQRGHRLGAQDTYNVIVSYVPDDPWSFADALENDTNGWLPIFKVMVREPGGQEQQFAVRVSDVSRGFLKEHKKELLAHNATVAADKVGDAVLPLLRSATPAATENLSLLQMANPAGENPIQISLSVSKDKIHASAAGTLSVALVRQSAYLRDSVFFAELKVQGGAAGFLPRDITANVNLTDEFRRTTAPGSVFQMAKGETSAISDLLEKAIEEAGALKLEPLPENREWRDRAFEMNMRLAEKTETIANYLDELREKLRDLGSEDSFDFRAKTIACYRPAVTPDLRWSKFQARLQTNAPQALLSISELRAGEHVTFFVPIPSTKRRCDLMCSCEVSTAKPTGLAVGEEVAQLDLSYGWFDSMDVCQSTIATVPSPGATGSRLIETPLTFQTANHFVKE